jgi:hypothetical protein
MIKILSRLALLPIGLYLVINTNINKHKILMHGYIDLYNSYALPASAKRIIIY